MFRSWDNPRANVYRRMNDIPYSWGTAVNVQMMAFGNMGDDCGTGVAFTRNPATGEKKLFGEFLINAQGEDVVAGIRTPMPIAQMAEKFPEVLRAVPGSLQPAGEPLSRYAGYGVHHGERQALYAADP